MDIKLVNIMIEPIFKNFCDLCFIYEAFHLLFLFSSLYINILAFFATPFEFKIII
jgi:hypothetical protein